MAHECFEDDEVAALMNEAFVCIKVDREVRPDIDDFLMTACLVMNGSGGWPLNVLLTADLKPFFACTYVPKNPRFGQPGMLQLVPRISSVWKNQRDSLLQGAEQLLSVVRAVGEEEAGEPGSSMPSHSEMKATARRALESFVERFDQEHGGFGRAPKFPSPHNLELLLRLRRRFESKIALKLVEDTLVAMRDGGIRDHVGGGFHRYATDREWRIPHFEKMLYDEAGIAISFLEAFQDTGMLVYASTAAEIFSYVIRDLAAPAGSPAAGAFFSAEDADSEGVEGKFYTWTKDQIARVLGERATVFLKLFGCSDGSGHEAVALHVRGKADAVAAENGMNSEQMDAFVAQALKDLFSARSSRVRPHRDENVLCDWNAFMAVALAKGSRVLSDDGLALAAANCCRFILGKMSSPDGGLFHHFKDGIASMPGVLDDYAFTIWALCEVAQATFDPSLLLEAGRLAKLMDAKFLDTVHGAYWFTASDAPIVGPRKKNLSDGAIPSGNSVALTALFLLAELAQDEAVRVRAESLVMALWPAVAQAPQNHSQFLAAVDAWMIGKHYHVVIATANREKAISESRALATAAFVPGLAVSWDEGKRPHDGELAFFVCSATECHPPVSAIEKVILQVLPK